MADKRKEQLLAELSAVQKMLEERTETQGQMIRKLQMLMANEGLFSQIIDFFPYPIAIYTPQYTLAMVNKAFTAKTNIRTSNREKETPRILQYKIDNTQLAVAITRVFAGETSFLENLSNPLSMFSEFTGKGVSQPDRFQKAVIFPVSAAEAKITHGIIVFMP